MASDRMKAVLRSSPIWMRLTCVFDGSVAKLPRCRKSRIEWLRPVGTVWWKMQKNHTVVMCKICFFFSFVKRVAVQNAVILGGHQDTSIQSLSWHSAEEPGGIPSTSSGLIHCLAEMGTIQWRRLCIYCNHLMMITLIETCSVVGSNTVLTR
jgi:hypothetical protein